MQPTSHTIRNRILYTLLGIVAFMFFVVTPIVAIVAIRYNCNTAYIALKGTLYTYNGQSGASVEQSGEAHVTTSEEIVAAIDTANADTSIQAIILEVDSYGGAPVAGEEIARALRNATKPTVAYIRQGGASAAYWAASGAEKIYASENSDIGGIGVTASYVDQSKYNEREGYHYNSVSSGTYKDTGNPDKPLTEQERALLMRDVTIIKNNFIRDIAKNRNLDISKVQALADGSTMLGAMALENKLIDGIGGLYEVQEYIRSKINSQPKICWE